jgi:L-amino acid N-acyltransferase YncA
MDEVQIQPVHPGNGMDVTAIFDHWITDATDYGIDTLLACISSRNPRSLCFHLRHGFEVVGRFERIGRWLEEDFCVVRGSALSPYMPRRIQP